MSAVPDVLGDYTVEWDVGTDGEYMRTATQLRKLALAQERTWQAVPWVNWEWNADPAWNTPRTGTRRVGIAEEKNRVRFYVPGSTVAVASTPRVKCGAEEPTPLQWEGGEWRHKSSRLRAVKKITKRRMLVLRRRRTLGC